MEELLGRKIVARRWVRIKVIIPIILVIITTSVSCSLER